ncbi:MAG: septum formation initiator family protein [Clostridia bacterium]|nr:septum formation initiator family protein [Clostridia bacterium]
MGGTERKRGLSAKTRSRLIAVTAVCAVLVAAALVSVSVIDNLNKRAELQAEYERLAEENAELLTREELLKSMLEYCGSDEYKVQLARELLGYVSPEDIVYEVRDPSQTATP